MATIEKISISGTQYDIKDANAILKGYAINDFATNCLTSVPQDIKLELSAGTLTLKSGSILTFPDGTQYTITADEIISTHSTDTQYVCVKNKAGGCYSFNKQLCYSGPTAPTGFSGNALWYDTTNNRIKNSSDGGSTWENDWSLPFGIVTLVNSVYTSIDKVFNGVGYIGHHVFVLPGVKGFVPDGFNSNGSYSSLVLTTTVLNIAEMGTNPGRVIGFQGSTNMGSFPYKTVDTVDALQKQYIYQYCKETNTTWIWQNSAWSNNTRRLPVVAYEYTGTTVTRFDVYPVSGLAKNYIGQALELTASKALATDSGGNITTTSVTATELGYVSGVTSAIQTQLNAKLNANTAITGATKCKITYDSKGLVTAGADLEATDIPSLTLAKISDVTASATEVNVLDGITATTTELNYVDGVTSSIQGQIGTLSSLGTITKTDLVAAINEVNTQAGTNKTDILTINGKIPDQATTTNQLADKSFVNSSVSTNTANFIGTFNSVADLEAYSGTVTNNDYAFVVTTDSAGNTVYNRYKYTTATTPASWVFEYALNNSSFTSDQWAAINSGATTTNIGQITTNATAIGTLQSLTTTVKTDLVSAVNEVNSTASGKVSDVQFNGTSITTSGIANISIATQAQVQAKSATSKALTPSNINDIGGSVSRSVYDNVQTITAGDINLVDGSVFYTTSPSSNTTYMISTSALTQTGFSYRYFNVILTQPSVPVTCDFTTNNNVKWTENTEPDVSVGGRTYLLAFQTFDGGTDWVGSLCTWWE